MRFDHNARVRVGVILFILFALYSNWQVFQGSVEFDLSFVGKDEITQYEKRFDVMRVMLPEHGTVGYAANIDYAHYDRSDAAALRDWFLAQYTLAPVMVSITTGHKLTIINYSGAAANADSSDARGLTVKELGSGNRLFDFGNGLRLVSNE